MENNAKSESEAMRKPELQEIQQLTPPIETSGDGGWGGWGFSSVFSDLQKAAEEISRNAAEAAKTAAQSIADMQIAEESSDSSKEDEIDTSGKEDDTEDEEVTRRKAALDKLENASEDTLLSQGLKVLDNSVENIASGAWQAFGNAWRGGSTFVQKLESSAASLADSINQGDAGSVAPSLLETGKAFTARGMQVLEHVGKETMDLLIAETGIEVDKKSTELEGEDQLLEEVTFDRYFYIYGGPEQLEELEALSSHHALLFNRRKTKLSSEQKSVYDSKLKQVQQIFSLDSEYDGIGSELEKGKQVETRTDTTIDEMKNLHDSSVSKAAELAAGFASALVGQTPSDIIQRTAGRLDSLHSEGVHRLSEMCCSAVSQLLMIGKSVISNADKAPDTDADDIVKIDWPEDAIEKAKVIRIRVQSMTGKVDEVSNSFITGISEVAEACSAAIKTATTDSAVFLQEKPIEEKTHEFSENLRVDQTTAIGKIQDGLQYLSYLVISSSMPAA
ncbi:hypothetical protein DCAR_0624094 [Daucus carota subsp. sativus]|uniref:DUF7798 domain-containing protein n=1 Tax=Daucus carota subsp. sativus TaxID=79200 RepID=A0AAF0XCW2_DAUCS|nr:PREDICTED: uncharacterized protein LOC108225735 [Daucus carota subsp. sativus]WOH04682.1 hypothetical protein DCAR_0624094 [Daucus carota subsp. sativus]